MLIKKLMPFVLVKKINSLIINIGILNYSFHNLEHKSAIYKLNLFLMFFINFLKSMKKFISLIIKKKTMNDSDHKFRAHKA